MSKKKFSFASLSFKLPLYLLFFSVILSFTTGVIGYRVFKSLFEKQYREITEQSCETGLSFINVDKIPEYAVKHIPDDDWYESDAKLDMLTVTSKLA